jgi:hypothetical protein
MNPYLEHPDLWSEVHSRLIVAIADTLAPCLRPKYYVAVEKRTYLAEPEDSVLVGIPAVSIISREAQAGERDQSSTSVAVLPSAPEPLTVTIPMLEEVQERYLEIREVKTGDVITVIEVLSPKNKRSGAGRDAYLHK